MKEIIYFLKFSFWSKYIPVQNIFAKICWLTKIYKNQFIKTHTIFGREGSTSQCGASLLSQLCTCVFFLKIVEWNQRNMLWLKQQNERSVFRCCVCVDLNRYWNTYWTDCVTEFELAHCEMFVHFVRNSIWEICTFSCFCRPLYYRLQLELKLVAVPHILCEH
jgi:hypothetical protein